MAERQDPRGQRGDQRLSLTFPYALPGLPVRGKVSLRERWDSSLAQVEDGFHIVLLTRPQAVPREDLGHERLAVCIPGRTPGRVAETQTNFFTGRLLTAEDLTSEQRVWRSLRQALLEGEIITPSGLLDPKLVFGPREPLAWFQRIGAHLMGAAEASLLAIWNDVLPYARLFREDLSPTATEEEARGQEKQLLERLEALRGALREALAAGKRMGRRLGPLPSGELSALTGRFLPLCEAQGLRAFYEVARMNYPDLTYLARDLARAQRLLELMALAPEIAAARAYLEKAVPPDLGDELALDRASLLEQVNAENLFGSPNLWPSLKSLWEWYRGRYYAAYRTHHARFQEEATALRRSLREAEGQLAALEMLDTIPELGAPLGGGLRGEYKAILKALRPCLSRSLSEFNPQCPRCKLALGGELPRERVQAFLARVQEALGEKQRRLSSQAIRQILALSGERRIDRFIKIVQSSDLAPLARVLDDELVAFLRRLLADSAPQSAPVLEKLKGRFPVVASGQVEEVVAELRALLEQALAQAKKRSPKKQVHLVLE